MRFITNIIGILAATFAVTTSAAFTPVYQITETTGTYLQTLLTHDIYRYSAATDLNDVVVVDNQGNKLPYRIVVPTAEINEKSRSIPVRFFPVAVGAAPETLLALSSASIRVDDNAISVSVEKKTNDELLDKAAPIDFFVIDISEFDNRVDDVIIDWQADESNQYLEVQVSGSNDLQNWSSITNSTLVQLQKDGQSLIRNKIALNLAEKTYAYLRLKFLRGDDNLQLTKIAINNNEKQVAAVIADKWQLNGTLAKDQASVLPRLGTSSSINNASVAAWEFVRDDITPVSRFSVDLGTSMYGDVINVFSRQGTNKKWQLVHQGIWFNVQTGSDWQQSDAIDIYGNSDTYWRVELNELVRTTINPTLVFHYQPLALQFIANNAAPYSIAIDDNPAPENQRTSARIFSKLTGNKALSWTNTNFIELKPDINSFARQMTHINWKTFLFWSILLIALGVLIGVVVRLMRQLSSQDSPQ